MQTATEEVAVQLRSDLCFYCCIAWEPLAQVCVDVV